MSVETITIEVTFSVDYDCHEDGSPYLKALHYPKSVTKHHNVMPSLSDDELVQAKAELESLVAQDYRRKAEKLDMRGDSRREMVRELQAETLQELQAQRGVR